jgi:hypothetical protein
MMIMSYECIYWKHFQSLYESMSLCAWNQVACERFFLVCRWFSIAWLTKIHLGKTHNGHYTLMNKKGHVE